MALFAGLGSALAGAGLGFIGDMYGSHLNRRESRAAEARNREMQEQFARNGLRWRMEDAQAAGIHPLAALGFNPSQPSPVAVGDTGVGDAYSRLGQNIGRAVSATQTAWERKMNAAQLEGALLNNDILRSQKTRIQHANNPPMPDSGVIETPLTRVAAERDRNWQEIGSYPSVAYMQSPTGLVPVMPPNLAEALESDQTNQIQWGIRYKGGPNFAPVERPSNRKLPAGKIGWVWNFKLQEWRPVSRGQAEAMGRTAMEKKYKPIHIRKQWQDYH